MSSEYIEILKKMTMSERLLAALALQESAFQLVLSTIRARRPELGEEELHRAAVERFRPRLKA